MGATIMIDPRIKKEIERKNEELKNFDIERAKKDAVKYEKPIVLATGKTKFCMSDKPGCFCDETYVCVEPNGSIRTVFEHYVEPPENEL
jgi:hypothetical protein